MTRVLFCGNEFTWSYQFTKEALAKHPDVEVLRCECSEVPDRIKDVQVAIPFMTHIDDATMERASALRLILQYGVGVEGIDIAAATRRGVWVSNILSAGTGNALSCAEHAIYLMLATLRDQNCMAASIQRQQLGVPLGQTLYGKTVLIVGFGNIAKELIPRLQPFGCTLLCVRRSPWGQQPTEAVLEQQLDRTGTWQDLHTMAAKADIIAMTCSQTPETKGMIDSKLLAACKPGVYIVNVARGGLLDYDAVKAALQSGRIGGLGLDVFAYEPVDPQDALAQHSKVVLTPHIAGVTEMSYRNMAEIVAQEVLQIHQGKPPLRHLNQLS